MFDYDDQTDLNYEYYDELERRLITKPERRRRERRRERRSFEEMQALNLLPKGVESDRRLNERRRRKEKALSRKRNSRKRNNPKIQFGS
jgi:parvulin-like peptidyl-prolyl isomerase